MNRIKPIVFGVALPSLIYMSSAGLSFKENERASVNYPNSSHQILKSYFAFYCPVEINNEAGTTAVLTINQKNKTIKIEMYLNYSGYVKISNPYGLNKNQISLLKTFKENIEDLWSGEFEIHGEEFEVSTHVTLSFYKSYELAQIVTQKNDGQNLVKNAERSDNIEGEIGIGTYGEILFLKKGLALNPRWNTGAHEAGHLLGLPDKEYSNSIMGYSIERNRPKDEEILYILYLNSNIKLDINCKQIVKNYSR